MAAQSTAGADGAAAGDAWRGGKHASGSLVALVFPFCDSIDLYKAKRVSKAFQQGYTPGMPTTPYDRLVKLAADQHGFVRVKDAKDKD